ncbi:MAG: peptide deformylase [Planctomycetes bacterium]|nr:peptide deformylase [Planctomycetota bacterium]MCH9727457.1 peptide deformylase [Planctomycetota bacterium]MCH9775962.1 peptide deformylase [Planctomycetota bacterium]MCH9789713.1 peptide deformylase [Planctomycetota bacterium]MDF1743482.1 peptide deformylase [Gimesia sp.]
MAALQIVNYPHPALRWKSKPIKSISPELVNTVRTMFDLMYEARGIGLAANQVGLPYRLFVINLTADPDETEEEFVFINPEITKRKGTTEGEEGCLSLPQLYGDVKRSEEITLEAYDLDGQLFEIALDDLAARAVQHEHDHLEGIMFPDRMVEDKRIELDAQIADFEVQFRNQQQRGEYPSDEEIRKELSQLELNLG